MVFCIWQELQLNFYGDATVEAWRGTQHGDICPGCAGAAEAFQAHFGQKFNSHAWGLAGGQSLHVFSTYPAERRSSHPQRLERRMSLPGLPRCWVCCQDAAAVLSSTTCVQQSQRGLQMPEGYEKHADLMRQSRRRLQQPHNLCQCHPPAVCDACSSTRRIQQGLTDSLKGRELKETDSGHGQPDSGIA